MCFMCFGVTVRFGDDNVAGMSVSRPLQPQKHIKHIKHIGFKNCFTFGNQKTHKTHWVLKVLLHLGQQNL